MTEEDWLRGDNPAGMVSFLRRRKSSDRKLRLFGCACCRRVWDRLPGEASRDAVEAAERFADGQAGRKDLVAALRACREAAHDPGVMVAAVSLQKAALWGPYNARVQAAGAGPLEASQLAAHTAAMGVEGLAQGRLLHDLFGNPFRPVTADPAWRTADVSRLALAAYDERGFPSGELDLARLGVLGDALEEAGADAGLVAHSRSTGPHVRGCWAVDVALARG
ncbi:MAG: hypothetical protein ACRC33_28260 [Gemmataceae bacterium]